MAKRYEMENNIMTNCTFIGFNAGADIVEGDSLVIIGDDVRSLDKNQKGVMFIGDKVAIGRMLFGNKLNLCELIMKKEDHGKKNKKA